jgi:NAD(P)-dependent dehydrogenase (short-subunit alcohol dehydrogenase family)
VPFLIVDVLRAPGEIRTPDPQVRSLMLYPTELRARRCDLTENPGRAGIIRTHFSKALWADAKRAAAFARLNPLRRLGDPDDVAGVAVLLAARAGSFITGQTLVVDGGGLIGGGEPL